MNVQCPTCQKNVVWNSNSEYRPFCSKKCQLIDLGEWADEQHSIPVKPNVTDIPMDIEEIEAMLAEQSEDFFKPQ